MCSLGSLETPPDILFGGQSKYISTNPHQMGKLIKLGGIVFSIYYLGQIRFLHKFNVG